MYWYHPDYLGSVEFVTDMRGEAYQFFLNTPWGENLENQYAHTYTSFSSRFRFNGKEWDEETGNFYYGARYYNPKISVWLTVDPFAHKYPSLSSYTFTGNNPIIFVDPDGKEFKLAGNNRKAAFKQLRKAMARNGVDLTMNKKTGALSYSVSDPSVKRSAAVNKFLNATMDSRVNITLTADSDLETE
ncbi:MAG: RHS repeat-associated core domain-containing protein [Bacteroidetes bacterium]|nr:RHS repeat-associated core domain-containing protein [Bacteroidota bacterium]